MADSQIVADVIRAMERIDGSSCHTGGEYVCNPTDLPRVRERIARRLARLTDDRRAHQLDVFRLWAAGESRCVVCENELLSLTNGVQIHGSRLMHGTCATAWNAFTADTFAPDARYEITPDGLAALVQDGAMEKAS